jgi:hypothetical protein
MSKTIEELKALGDELHRRLTEGDSPVVTSQIAEASFHLSSRP